jgi:hypothetical protein
MQLSEVFRLALMALVLPPFLLLNRQVRSAPGCWQLLGAFYVIAASYVFTAAEPLFLTELLNTLQHVCYGLGGALTLWGAVTMIRAGRREEATP